MSFLNSIWLEAQPHLPKNIYNFTIRYINNSLPTRTIWQDGDYYKVLIAPFVLILNHSFMLSLVVNSTLIALHGDTSQSLTSLPRSLQPVINVHSSLYADVTGFLNPSIITSENYPPDLLFLIQSKCLYVLQLTVGFESNLNNNAVRKKEKYVNLINEMSRNYRCVRFCKSLHEFPWRFLR